MPPVDPNALAADVRVLLNQPVPEGTCYRDQPVCTPDPRVTAQLISIEPVEQILPWRIRNADAGDLLLTPGGPAGFIGAMLGQLDPPEQYSHMGIFTRDGTSIRHCTTSEEALRRFPHKADNLVADASRTIAPDSLNEAPTDGFDERHLKHQWPGTITQSVEAAYLSARNWNNEADTYKIHHDELNDDFVISALTFKPEALPVQNQPSRLLWPMLVKTTYNPRFTATQHNAVEAAKQRVVRYVEDMRCHYRFYSYTRADIGLAEDGPPQYETSEPALLAGCSGLAGRAAVSTQRTAGAQCASLIWLAVQKANADAASGASPFARISLDYTSVDPAHVYVSAERSYQQPIRVGADRITNAGTATQDGLYYFPKGERQRAAEHLYAALHENVVKQIKESVQLQQAFDNLTDGEVGKPLWIVYNLLMAGIPMVLIPAMLGITDWELQTLVRFFSDIPDDVANQTTNAFASDDCSQDAKDSDAWTNPGIGETVSPDATYRYWSPPVLVMPGERVIGLWGRNVIAAPPTPPTRIKNGPAPSTWQISTGDGQFIRARVTRREGNGMTETPGAMVRIGCLRMVSGENGLVPNTNVPAGVYWCEAWWDQPVTGIRYAAIGQAITIVEGQPATRDFLLQPPEGSLRAVWLKVHMDNVNREPVGKDWWDHPDYTTQFHYLGADLVEPVLALNITDGRQIDDWGRAEFAIDVTLITAPSNPGGPPQWSLRLNWKIRLNQADADDPWRDKGEIIVPPKADPLAPPIILEDDLSRLDLWPVRSHIRIEVHNDLA